MPACVSYWLYLLRTAFENLMSQNFPTHRETHPGMIFHLFLPKMLGIQKEYNNYQLY